MSAILKNAIKTVSMEADVVNVDEPVNDNSLDLMSENVQYAVDEIQQAERTVEALEALVAEYEGLDHTSVVAMEQFQQKASLVATLSGFNEIITQNVPSMEDASEGKDEGKMAKIKEVIERIIVWIKEKAAEFKTKLIQFGKAFDSAKSDMEKRLNTLIDKANKVHRDFTDKTIEIHISSKFVSSNRFNLSAFTSNHVEVYTALVMAGNALPTSIQGETKKGMERLRPEAEKKIAEFESVLAEHNKSDDGKTYDLAFSKTEVKKVIDAIEKLKATVESFWYAADKNVVSSNHGERWMNQIEKHRKDGNVEEVQHQQELLILQMWIDTQRNKLMKEYINFIRQQIVVLSSIVNKL